MPARIVADRFEIEAAAGQGRTTVYRARDLALGGTVALKLLEGATPMGQARFLREGATLARLAHPNIVGYVAHGATPEGVCFLAMEWLEGEDLASRVARGPLAPAEAAATLAEVARALAAAHAAGIVHRDVKPSNVFLVAGPGRRVKLLDFGVARDPRHSKITHAGHLVGTPEYVAPEQARGDAEVDARADFFSLGCVLYECLTGRSPFAADTAIAALAKVLLDDPPPVEALAPNLPSPLASVTRRMMSKAVAERPSDAAEIAAILDGVAVGLPSASTAPAAPSITPGEERVLCVVMAGDRDVAPVSTLTPESAARVEARMREKLAAINVDAVPIGTNAIVAAVPPTGSVRDDAVRAAETALAIHEAYPAMAVVVAMGKGRVEGRALPVGAVIDRGARALREADAGAVVIDGRLAPHLVDRFELAGEGEARALVRRLVGEPRGEARTLLGKETPCVGRDVERGLLVSLARAAWDEPAAELCVVLGPAGTGKSRLRYELLRATSDVAPRVLVARGDPLAPGSAYGLARQLVRRAGPIALAGAEARAQLAAMVARVVPADADEVTVFLGELAGVPFPSDARPGLAEARADPIALGQRMAWAWQRWIAAEADARPLLVVLEDAQWGDGPSVQLVLSTLEALAERRLFVLAIGRPEVEDVLPSLIGAPGAHVVRLGALKKKACEALVRAALGDALATPELCARLAERCEGNALYLEELIRAVAIGNDRELPETVLGMVHARLDPFGPEAKRVLRAASVFGARSWRSGVLKVLGEVEATSRHAPWLDELVRQEVLSRVAESAYEGEVEYAFRHGLIRDAAYGMLTDADRRLAHALAAEWMQERGERDPLALAEHFERAGQPERATPYYLHAALAAQRAGAYEDTVATARRGLAAAADVAVRAELLVVVAEGLALLGTGAEAIAAAEDALAVAEVGSAPFFRALGHQLVGAAHVGAYEVAERSVRKAMSTDPRRGDDGARLAALVCLCRGGVEMFNGGRRALGEELLGRVAEIAPDPDALHPSASGWVHWARGWRALHHSDPAGFVRGARAARAAFEAASDPARAARSTNDLGYGHMQLGEYEAAERFYRDAIVLGERQKMTRIVAAVRQNLGATLGRLGRPDEARVEIGRSLTNPEIAADPRLAGGAWAYLAQVSLEAGETERAEREATEGARVAAALPPIWAFAESVRARALARLGRGADAALASARAHAELDRLGGLEEGDAYVRLARVEALLAAGDRDAARDAAHAARDALVARAAAISDDALRARFLAAVAENARTLELARELDA